MMEDFISSVMRYVSLAQVIVGVCKCVARGSCLHQGLTKFMQLHALVCDMYFAYHGRALLGGCGLYSFIERKVNECKLLVSISLCSHRL
jgi:hypothetical protein